MRNIHRIDRSVNTKAGVSAGFTLVELMVTASIVAILVTIAAPSIRDRMIRNRIDAESGGLTADLTFARTQAVMRAAPVVVCPTDAAAASCVGSNWNAPRLVFVDTEGEPLVLDSADVLLRLSEAPPSDITLTPSSQINGVRFLPNGTAGSLVAFETCHPDYTGRVVTLRRVGSVSATQPTAEAC